MTAGAKHRRSYPLPCRATCRSQRRRRRAKRTLDAEKVAGTLTPTSRTAVAGECRGLRTLPLEQFGETKGWPGAARFGAPHLHPGTIPTYPLGLPVSIEAGIVRHPPAQLNHHPISVERNRTMPRHKPLIRSRRTVPKPSGEAHRWCPTHARTASRSVANVRGVSPFHRGVIQPHEHHAAHRTPPFVTWHVNEWRVAVPIWTRRSPRSFESSFLRARFGFLIRPPFVGLLDG